MYIFTLIIFDKLYTSRELSLLKKILIIGAISISKGALNMIDIPIVKFITAFVLLILVNLVFYKPPGKVFLIYDAIYMITSSIVEMLSTLMLAFMLNVTTEDIKFSPVLFLAATILSWIVMIAVAKCFLLIVAGKGMNNIRTHEFLMFLVLMIGEILLFQYLNDKISSSNSRWEIVVILLTFLSLDLYLAYLIRMISRAYQTEKELELVTQQSMLQLNAYKEGGFDRINPSILKADILTTYPDFNERTIGFKRFSDVMKQLEKEGIVKVEMDEQRTMLLKLL